MEWTITWQGESLKVQLPADVPAGELASGASVAGASNKAPQNGFSYIWEERLRTLIVRQAGSPLERCLSVRGRRLQKDPFEASSELDLEVTGVATSVIKAKISPLASGEAARQSRREASGTVLRSPMTGKVLQVLTSVGAQTEQGQALVIIEAMKMENQIFAPQAGLVKELKVKTGDLVQVGAELLKIDNT